MEKFYREVPFDMRIKPLIAFLKSKVLNIQALLSEFSYDIEKADNHPNTKISDYIDER